MLVSGTSFIPNNGNQTQNIPPITSVNDNKVNSAAGIALEPIEYKINPKQTNVPCNENNDPLTLVEKKGCFKNKIIIVANIKQNKPATATVVNLGVSFLHLKETENMEKPIDEVIPKIKPTNEFVSLFPIAIIIIPIVAITIETQTFKETLSFKNKKANNAVKKGIAARQSNVIATEVFVIE